MKNSYAGAVACMSALMCILGLVLNQWQDIAVAGVFMVLALTMVVNTKE